MGNDRRTPIGGYPTDPLLTLVADIKQDLRDHIAADADDNAAIHGQIDALQSQIGTLRLESAGQSASLARIEISLSRNEKVSKPPLTFAESQLQKDADTRRTIVKWVVRAALAGAAAGGGALLHWLL